MIGTPADSCVIPGVVLRKNVAHRKMRTQIHNPKLLLLSGGALEIECDKLAQLHTMMSKVSTFLLFEVTSKHAFDRSLRS